MRTRLRAARTREDDLPQARSQSTPQPIPAPAAHSLAHLQRTLGNASLQRYLGGHRSTSPTPDVIRRDAAKVPPADAAPGTPRTIVFLTMTTSDGKPLRGTSKRKGHEGQFELESVQLGVSIANRSGRTVPGRRDAESETKHSEGGTTTTSKERVEFVVTRHMDDFSPTLVELTLNGKGVKLKLEWVRIDQDGRETKHMTLESADGMFTSYHVGSADTGKHPMPLESVGVQLQGTTTTIPDMPQAK